MALEIEFSDESIAELKAAVDNCWHVSEALAMGFAEAYDRCTAQLLLFPYSGLAEPDGRYSTPIADFGYRIVYEVANAKLRPECRESPATTGPVSKPRRRSFEPLE